MLGMPEDFFASLRWRAGRVVWWVARKEVKAVGLGKGRVGVLDDGGTAIELVVGGFVVTGR